LTRVIRPEPIPPGENKRSRGTQASGNEVSIKQLLPTRGTPAVRYADEYDDEADGVNWFAPCHHKPSRHAL
jgi:hypothetical protein